MRTFIYNITDAPSELCFALPSNASRVTMFSLDWELAVYDAAEDSGGEKAPLLDIDGGIVLAVESSKSSSLWWSESELSAQLSLC